MVFVNLNTKGRATFTADDCDDTSVAAIENDFVEVSKTERKFNLIVFDYDISNKSIPIASDTNYINKPNVTIISKLNEKLLLHWVPITCSLQYRPARLVWLCMMLIIYILASSIFWLDAKSYQLN